MLSCHLPKNIDTGWIAKAQNSIDNTLVHLVPVLSNQRMQKLNSNPCEPKKVTNNQSKVELGSVPKLHCLVRKPPAKHCHFF